MLGFQVDQILHPLLGLPVDRVNKRKGHRSVNRLMMTMKTSRLAMRDWKVASPWVNHAFFDLDVGVHFGADGLHQHFALAAHQGQHGGRVVAAVQPDDLGHLRQFGIHEGSHGLQVFPGLTHPESDYAEPLVGLQAVALGKIGREEGFVAGQQEAPLTGFRIANSDSIACAWMISS